MASAQIVYPKNDLGYIAARTGMNGGQTVLEIGTGSGSLTGFAAGINLAAKNRNVKLEIGTGNLAAKCTRLMWMKNSWQLQQKTLRVQVYQNT